MFHPGNLAGVRLKIDRADKHIQEIEAWNDCGVFNINMYSLLEEAEPDGIHKIKKIRHRFRGEVPNDILACIGDAIHNMRSALDHLACVIALRHNPNIFLKDIPSFPIKRSEEEFIKSSTQILKYFGADGLHFFSSLQPYNGGNGEKGMPLLWAIHRLDITDKHRTLLTTGVYIHIRPATEAQVPWIIDIGNWQSLKEDVTISRWPVGETEPKMEYVLNVAFAEPEVRSHEPVRHVLETALDLVQWIVAIAERDLSL